MILNSDQIKALLSQGAITDAQAQSLAASNNVSQQQAAPSPTIELPETEIAGKVPNTKYIDNFNVPSYDAGKEARPPPPPPTPTNGYPNVANQPPLPDQGPAAIANAEATDRPLSSGGFNVDAYNKSIQSHAPMAMRGAPFNQAGPPIQNTDALKGTNTLTGAGAQQQPGQAMGQQPPVQRNDPATLYMPKSQWAPPNLAPEKKYLGAELGYGKESVEALDKQREQQEKLNQMQSIATDTAGNIAIQNSSAMMKEQNENKAAWDAAMKRADEQSAEISARAREIGSRKIDPERYWNSMDRAGQFFAGLSLSLGAVGASIMHTQNFAMERMENAIKRDVDAQKADIETAYKGLGIEEEQSHSDLQRAQINAAYKDKQTLQHWEFAKQQAQGMMAKMQAPLDKQKADIVMGGIDDQIRQARLGMATNIYNFETLQRKANTGPAGTSESEVRKYITDQKAKFMEKGDNEQDANDRAIKLASERFNLKMQGGQATLPTLEDDKTKERKDKLAALTVNLPNGEKAEARSEAAANEYNKRQMAIGQLASISRRMKAIRERNNGGTLLNRADIAEARSLQEQAVNQYNEITGFNRAPGQPERTGLKGEVIPDVTDYAPSGSVDRKLNSLMQFVQNAHDLNNKTYLKEPPKGSYDIINGMSGDDLAASIGAKPIGK